MAYALLGATWLVMKSEGALQQRMRSASRTVAGVPCWRCIAVISLWTPLAHSGDCRPLVQPAESLFPAAGAAAGDLVSVLAVAHAASARPPCLALHADAGPGLSRLQRAGDRVIWPHIIPPAITLWQAAAPAQSQGFMLVGALLIIPVILGLHLLELLRCSAAKVQPGEGYH